MLSKINRIKKKRDFELIFKKAKSFKNNLFVFKTMKNRLDASRFGFIVSQKVSRKATVRNKIRRRLMEAVRLEMRKIKGGADSILIALPGIEKKDFPEIEKALSETLNKAKLIKNV